MKRFLLLLTMIVSVLSLSAQNIGNFTVVSHNGYDLQYTITSVSPAECTVACSSLTSETAIDVITIPETITMGSVDYSVTSLAYKAFSYCYSVKKFELPNTLRTINNEAFYYCNLATEIAIPESVTHIGDKAFYGCPITEVVIPSGITKINPAVFQNCTELKSVVIPSGVTSIGTLAFKDCTSLTEIEIPESVTTIGDYAFSRCISMKLMRCLAATPPTCNKIFVEVPEDIIIRVPSSSVDLYKSTSPWKNYDIRSIDTEGLDENIESMGIYPNPAKENIIIEAESNIEEVTIYNVTGVMVHNVQCTMNNVQLNVSDLNCGVYFVKVRTENGDFVKRIVKE